MTKSQSNLSQLKDFLSYIATVKGDLSNITAPPFLLSPKSVTEIPASWAERHKLFLQPSFEEDPAQRALLILKNFLCSLKRQVYSTATDASEGGAKKPLNAFLGELFIGTFEDEESGSKTQFISEQVSHHPPVTACFVYNREHGISSSGYVAQETSFSPTGGVSVNQIGHVIIRDEKHQESHLMTLPTMAVNGLMTGSPYPELSGTCYIVSSSGYLATIDFRGKKALGLGTKNKVEAELCNIRDNKKVLYEIGGQWNGKMTITDSLKEQVVEEFDVDEIPLTELKVKPIDKQNPWESRKAWGAVIAGIKAGNAQTVGDEKNKIEEAQRELRTAEKEGDVDWMRVFFTSIDDQEEFKLLSSAIPDEELKSLRQDRTAGVWRFVGVPAAEAILKDGVYHKSLEPTGQVGSNSIG